jgi:glycosyltransferase involved in cell wall biosynthesis
MTALAQCADVLFVCEYFAPALRAGGGARSLVNTVALLGDRFRFAVVTRNHDVGERRPFDDPPSNRWVRVGGADVYYAADRDLTLRQLRRRVGEADPRVVYLNSLFSVLAIRMLLLRRAGRLGGRSVVVAPEGELGPGALATRPLRKQLYLRLARRAGLFRGVAWKAASAPEAELIRAWFGAGEAVTVATSLSLPAPIGAPAVGDTRGLARRRRGELELIFLSRLGPKKNLLFLLEALQRARAPIHLGIAGPIADAAYWRRCESALAALPANLRVTLHGALHPDQVAGVLARYDVFALPTLDENYGYVVLEALAAGCRLLLSPHTPWTDVERAGVGRILEVDDPARWRAELEVLAEWPDADFERSRDLAVDYARRQLANDEPLRQVQRLLAAAVARSPAG